MANSVAAAAAAVAKRLPQAMARTRLESLTMVRSLGVGTYRGSYHGCCTISRGMSTNAGVGVTEAEWSEIPARDDSAQQSSQQQAYYSPPPPSSARRRFFENEGRQLNFIAMGRAMQLALNSQKEFEMFLDKCSAYGVMLPENPGDVKRNLHELDPKETWIVVDSRAVLKFAKKLAMEEADRKKGEYPAGFVEDMLNRDKYGRYNSDDEY